MTRHCAGLDLPADRFVVAVTGGSQGSRALNESVTDFVTERAGDASLAVLQVVGERFLPDVAVIAGDIVHRVVGFVDRIELVYAAADLLIGRGGASTVVEVAVTGIPAILVPWAASAEDHQTLNVRWLADQGAAVLLAEGDLGAARRHDRQPS